MSGNLDGIVLEYYGDSTLKATYHYNDGNLTTFISYDTLGRITRRGQYVQALRPDTVEIYDGQTFESSMVVTGDSSMVDVKSGLWETHLYGNSRYNSIIFDYYISGRLDQSRVYKLK